MVYTKPYAVFEDVAGAFERDIQEDQRPWVEELIERAARLLRVRVPSLAARLDDGSQDPQNVTDAVVTAVLRVVRNPEGLGSEMEGSYQISLNRDVSAGKLFYTGDELVMVRPTRSASPQLIRSTIPRWRIP